MFIHEISKRAHLTRKAIEYYIQQGLIAPAVMENGYRKFTASDLQTLNRISALRKLDISVEDIQKVLNDSTNETLQRVLLKKELSYQRDLKKKEILGKLLSGNQLVDLKEEILALEQSKTILERLLESFPGYYGRFITMHFARFLDEPIRTPEQIEAYRTVVSFLDNLDELEIPEELTELLEEHTSNTGIEDIESMQLSTEAAYDHPETFLEENRDMLQSYIDYKKSDEYQQSSVGKLMQLMRDFQRSSGYNDVFLPAMKVLSPKYSAYYEKIEYANQKLLETFPDVIEMYKNESTMD